MDYYFPEEPLNLSPSVGGGYYLAEVHQKLNDDKYKVIRKLGYGPRSSTWLVLRVHDPTYFAVKIFTVTASDHAKTVEIPILKAVNYLSFSQTLPRFHGSFWEKGSAGSHLCFVLNPLSTSIQDLQQHADNQRFPVHVVQRIVWCVASTLKDLHNIKIMHGQIKAENIFFSTATQIDCLKRVLDSEPAPPIRKIKKFTTVISQPLQHTFKWNDKNKVVADWPVHLDGFGHAQHRSFKPEPGVDYLSAPETLLQEASCSPQTDIWMLGCLTFTLLTGKPPFQANENGTKQITDIRALLEDDVPKEWLSDSNIQNHNAEDPGPVTSIEAHLAEVLKEDEVPEVLDFIKCCLRLDPKKRAKAGKCADHEWLSMANACSCCF